MTVASESISPRRKISIVTGTFNEGENVQEFFSRVLAVMNACPQYDWELTVIDNASTDNTAAQLRQLAASEKRLKVILNSRNFGHIRSGYHAMLQSYGDAIILICSDLQDPPEMIPEFIQQWEKGFKAIVGVKQSSEETPLFFLLRKCYYRLVHRLADIDIIQNFTGFGLYDKQIIDILRSLKDPYPYFRGLISEIGLPTQLISYRQPRRKRGLTKSNFYILYDLAMLGITRSLCVWRQCWVSPCRCSAF
jgi:glycosyltransferase involved in cell wall biosynthesis